ncbi:hypothetical protein HNV27_37520, partial [Myxococcus xanthus]|uniref:HD domain-containing protein n=1 Tax=Myxococcus xanthus TaxID=34 RepID=UPI0018238E16|nr:hypothetical protein [Myxococcus xanthus]
MLNPPKTQPNCQNEDQQQRLFPWGKLTLSPDGVVKSHPLLDHMTDVAVVLDLLLRVHSIHRALERAAGRDLEEVDRARLAVLAFLHDVGKANA